MFAVSRSAVLAFSVALTGAAAAAGAAQAAPAPLPLGGLASDLTTSADGSVRVSVATWSGTQGSASMRTLSAGATELISVPLLRAAPKQTFVSPVLTSTGALVTYEDRSGRVSRLQARTLSADGTAIATQTLSSADHDAWAGRAPAVGPTGAVAVPYFEDVPKGALPMLAFRPAGTTQFSAPVALGSVNDGERVEMFPVLGPDGGGVIVSLPHEEKPKAPYVRRLSPAGAIGPRIALTGRVRDFSNTVAAFDARGNLFIAFADIRSGKGRPGSLSIAALPAGASEASPVVRIGPGGVSATERGNLSMVISPGGVTTLLAGRESGGQWIYTGLGTDLHRTTLLKSPNGMSGTLVEMADGGLAAVWTEASTRGSRREGLYGARRPAGGTFNAPHALVKPSNVDDSLQLAVGLPDGKVAIAYMHGAGEDQEAESFLAVATP